jgi:hypothetical protein
MPKIINRRFVFIILVSLVIISVISIFLFLILGSSNQNYIVLNSYNNNVKIHNQIYDISQEQYKKILIITGNLNLNFQTDDTFSKQIDNLQKAKTDLNLQKEEIEKNNQFIVSEKVKITKEPNTDMENFAMIINLALETYINFNQEIVTYLNFYNCQLDNLSSEIEILEQIDTERQKLANLKTVPEITTSLRIMQTKYQELAVVYQKLNICFNDQNKNFKPIEFNTQNQSVINSLTEVSKAFGELANNTEANNQQKINEFSGNFDSPNKKAQENIENLKNSLKKVLENMVLEIKSSGNSVDLANKKVLDESNRLKNVYNWK